MTRIKELREALGIKQEELALLCDVTQSTVSLWEIGKTFPRPKALGKLSERFGVSAGYILGIEDDDTKAPAQLPRTPEARIVSGAMDRLPKEQRDQIVAVVRAMYSNRPELFSEKGENQ